VLLLDALEEKTDQRNRCGSSAARPICSNFRACTYSCCQGLCLLSSAAGPSASKQRSMCTGFMRFTKLFRD